MSEPETTASSAHPPLPVVHDEAGDTPAWLPISGLVLFVLFAMMTFWRASHPAEDAAPDGAVVVVEAPE